MFDDNFPSPADETAWEPTDPNLAVGLYDCHNHTVYCKHAIGEMDEYVQIAVECGLKGLVFTCHNPVPDAWSLAVRMGFESMQKYCDDILACRERWAGRCDVQLGLECDYVPGHRPWIEMLMRDFALTYRIGSVHCHMQEYIRAHWNGSVAQYVDTYFDLVAEAAESGLFSAIGHLDLVKNMLGEQWKPDLYLEAVEQCLDRIEKTGTAIEINTSGAYKNPGRMYPDPLILKAMAVRKIPIVLGSDAHSPDRVADLFGEAMELALEAGYSTIYNPFARNAASMNVTIKSCLAQMKAAANS